jgi:hypothetical protein
LDLAELSQRTGIDRRQLRYVLDHGLIPDLDIKIVGDEVGRPRHFHEDVGFAIVCVTTLLDLGLPHRTIRRFLGQMIKIRLTEDSLPALARILTTHCPAFADLGDGKRVRLRVEGDSLFLSGWMPVARAQQAGKEYSPLVTVTLDIGRIRDQIFSPA